MFDVGIVISLSQLPATDGNFKSALKRATSFEIEEAIGFMEKHTGHHKSRIIACERELKRRAKNG